MRQYAIRSVHLFSAFKFGCLIGAIIAALPGVLLALVARWVIRVLYGWLETWETWSVDIAGRTLAEVDLLNLVKLSEFSEKLRIYDDLGWMLVIGLSLAMILVGGVLSGILSVLGTAVFNVLSALSGGLVVNADIVGGVVPDSEWRGSGSASSTTSPGSPVDQVSLWSPPQSVRHAWLAHPQQAGQHWTLMPDVTRIGSAPDNDIIFPDLSPHHAEIRLEDNRYILYNLITGQTWVNEHPMVRPNLLKPGFTVRFGKHVLTFLDDMYIHDGD